MSRTVPSSLGAEAHAMSVGLGFVEWATLFLQELIHGSFDLRGAPAVMRERPPMCVTDCKSLYGEKGEAVECLRRSLRSGSRVLRSEEQVMHERQLSRTSEKLEEKSTVEQS